MFARVLALSGAWDVVVLEKGRNMFSGLGGPTAKVTNAWANDELSYEVRTGPIDQDPVLEPRSFRASPSDGDRTYVGAVQTLPTTVGGGTVHFDAKARRLREVDFITNSLMGGTQDKPAIEGTTYTDWPFEYRHLEPFYGVAEEVLGVQGPAMRVGNNIYNPNPYESWRSTPFPMPPGVPMLSGLLPAEAADRLGYHAAPVPTAVTSRPYRDRPACSDCGFCLNYGCPTNAKSSGVWPFHDALATGATTLITEANAVSVEYGRGPSGRYRATGVTYLDDSGATRHVAGELVVLANSPIEAVRLGLLSGIGAALDPSGMLGKNLMFHLQTGAVAVMDQDIHSWRGRCSSHTLDAFAGSGPSPGRFDPAVPRGGIVEIGGNLNPVSQANAIDGAIFGDLHKLYMELGPFTKRLTTFTLQGEDMPQLTNYVDLDPELVDVWGQPVPRITYQNHAYELGAAAYYAPLMLAILETIGGPGSQYPVQTLASGVLPIGLLGGLPGAIASPIDNLFANSPISPIPASAHIMGTHRMALDQEGGPCDPYGRYWAFDNLYHVGGGLFPTAPGFNPTLTVWSLAYRAAAAVVSGVAGQSSYTSESIDADQLRLESVIRTLDPDTMIARVV
jgi:gluconate 2-dehydrogenase alpha chain